MERNHKIVGGRPKVLNPKEFYITASFTKNEWGTINVNACRLGITKRIRFKDDNNW